jgi:hypothetical protein
MEYTEFIQSKKHSIGAMWCFYAAFAPLLSLIIYKLKDYYINK